jgi:hypothetical protein
MSKWVKRTDRLYVKHETNRVSFKLSLTEIVPGTTAWMLSLFYDNAFIATKFVRSGEVSVKHAKRESNKLAPEMAENIYRDMLLVADPI